MGLFIGMHFLIFIKNRFWGSRLELLMMLRASENTMVGALLP